MAARWSRLSVSTASPARTISCCKPGTARRSLLSWLSPLSQCSCEASVAQSSYKETLRSMEISGAIFTPQATAPLRRWGQ